MTQTVVDGFW